MKILETYDESYCLHCCTQCFILDVNGFKRTQMKFTDKKGTMRESIKLTENRFMITYSKYKEAMFSGHQRNDKLFPKFYSFVVLQKICKKNI